VNVIFNNGVPHFVKQQKAGFVPFGTEFANPDFSQVATAPGARGIWVKERGDVRDALRAALAHTDGARRGGRGGEPLCARPALAVPAETAKGFTLSIAKQVPSGTMDEVIETIETTPGSCDPNRAAWASPT
jgi:pyruvate dehydrogenase (quinone)